MNYIKIGSTDINAWQVWYDNLEQYPEEEKEPVGEDDQSYEEFLESFYE